MFCCDRCESSRPRTVAHAHVHAASRQPSNYRQVWRENRSLRLKGFVTVEAGQGNHPSAQLWAVVRKKDRFLLFIKQKQPWN